MLNNWAFAFNISVPMHIILRSFGSVQTMAVGWLVGKRYTRVQVGSVVALTVGVVVSAWADAVGKVSFVASFPSLYYSYGEESALELTNRHRVNSALPRRPLLPNQQHETSLLLAVQQQQTHHPT